MTEYVEFDSFLEIVGPYDLIELPSGEFVSIADVYRLFSPKEYESHYQRWKAFDLTEDEITRLDLHNLK